MLTKKEKLLLFRLLFPLIILGVFFTPSVLAQGAYTSSNQLIYETRNIHSSSERLPIFVQGFQDFPQDYRIESELNRAVRSLLNWTTQQHENGNFAIAEERYNLIQNTDGVYDSLLAEAKYKSHYARNQEKLPSVDYYRDISNLSSSSLRLNHLLDGYKIYRDDKTIQAEITKNIRFLLDWTIDQHKSGHFSVAAERYELMLKTLFLEPALKEELETRLKYARNQKVIPTATFLSNKGKSESASSISLAYYLEGHILYPNINTFQTNIESRANALFNWARSQQLQGNASIAKNRYKMIENLMHFDFNMPKEFYTYYEQSLIDYAFSYSSSSDSIALLQGYQQQYPQFENLASAVNNRTRALLNWTSEQHKKENFSTTIDRYSLMLISRSLSDTLRTSVEYAYNFANQELLTPEMFYSTTTDLSDLEERFNMFVSHYKTYNENALIQKGIIESAHKLLDYAENITEKDIREAARYFRTVHQNEYVDKNTRLRSKDLFEENLKILTKSFDKPLDRFLIYNEAYNMGITLSALHDDILNDGSIILSEGIEHHHNGQYLDATVLFGALNKEWIPKSDISDTAEVYLKYSSKQKPVPSAKEMVDAAISHSGSSNRLIELKNVYLIYPDYDSLPQIINTHARSLLNWTLSRHNEGDYQTALNRYNLILNTPLVNSSLVNEVELMNQFALKSAHYQDTKTFINIIKDTAGSSNRLTLLRDYYEQFTEKDLLHLEIESQSINLLNWISSYHEAGAFDLVIDRYSLIQSMPYLSETLTREVELKFALAQKGENLPTVNQYISETNKNKNLLSRYNEFFTGRELFPRSKLIVSAYNDSVDLLLADTIEKHKEAKFKEAIKIYNQLLADPFTSDQLKSEVEFFLELASSEQVISQEIFIEKKYNYTINDMLSRQLSLNPPPQTDLYQGEVGYIQTPNLKFSGSSFITGSSVNLRTSPSLSNSDNIYKNVSYGTIFQYIESVTGSVYSNSSEWYKIKLPSIETDLYVHSSLATINGDSIGTVITRAGVYEKPNLKSHLFYSAPVNRAYKILETNSTWTKVQSRTVWRNARPSDAIKYIDPVLQDRFQFLVLSSSVNVSASELNKILFNKGVLHEKGELFIKAGEKHSVNEIYLISHALLESGNGTSDLAIGKIEVGVDSSGTAKVVTSSNRSSLKNIKPTFNLFGIGAVDSDPYVKGALRAYREEWFTVEAAIIGGADFIGRQYIHNEYGQDTLYKMRWNPDNPGFPQYATDMGWASKQINRIKHLYGQINNPRMVFDIPIYKK